MELGHGHVPEGRGACRECRACAVGSGRRGARLVWQRHVGAGWGMSEEGCGALARVRRCGVGRGHIRERWDASGPGGACVMMSRRRGARLMWWPTEGHVSGVTCMMCCWRCSWRRGLGWPGGMAGKGGHVRGGRQLVEGAWGASNGAGHVHKGLGCTGWGLAACLGIGGLSARLLGVG